MSPCQQCTVLGCCCCLWPVAAGWQMGSTREFLESTAHHTPQCDFSSACCNTMLPNILPCHFTSLLLSLCHLLTCVLSVLLRMLLAALCGTFQHIPGEPHYGVAGIVTCILYSLS